SEGIFALVRALRYQDKHTDALDVLDRMEAELGLGEAEPGGPVNPRRTALRRVIRFERARLLSWLARLGLCDARQAIGLLPTVEEAETYPKLRSAWVEAVENLVCQGSVRNDWRLGVRVTTWSRYFERVGAPRRGAELALAATRLASGRGARWVAECSAQRAERLIRELGAAEEIIGDLAEVRSMVRGMKSIQPMAPAAGILEFLRAQPAEEVNPEEQAEQVNVALMEQPHDNALLSALGQVGRTLMLSDAATEPQWRHVREQPGDQRAALSLLETLLHDNDTAGVRNLVRTLAAGALVPQQQREHRSIAPQQAQDAQQPQPTQNARATQYSQLAQYSQESPAAERAHVPQHAQTASRHAQPESGEDAAAQQEAAPREQPVPERQETAGAVRFGVSG
ncbi:MAG: hypothetical protein JK586_01450, partial [Nocardiopsis sp. BM-2018]